MIWCPDIGSMDQQSGTTSSNAPPSWGKQPACVWYPEVVQRKLLDAAGGHCSALIHSLATTQPSPRILSASPSRFQHPHSSISTATHGNSTHSQGTGYAGTASEAVPVHML